MMYLCAHKHTHISNLLNKVSIINMLYVLKRNHIYILDHMENKNSGRIINWSFHLLFYINMILIIDLYT